MSDRYRHTDSTDAFGERRQSRADAYRIRMMLSLVAALGLATVALRVPLRSEPERMGWNPVASRPLIEISQSESSKATRHDDGSVESFGVPDAAQLPEPVESSDANAGGNDDRLMDVGRMRARDAVYEFVDSPPEIRGGLGAYYINIEYPEEAVRLGIEGRLLLRFVVDTEGRPTDISVRQSLHPLCDSAAVRALRATKFVAGSQNGKTVPVRMHLPVRFRLVEAGTLSRLRDSSHVGIAK